MKRKFSFGYILFIFLFIILLAAPFVALSGEYYGTNWGADNLCNTIIGGRLGTKADYRFRADYSGSITQLRIYLTYDSSPGYYNGTGGKLKISLETDDETDNHFPSGIILASVIDNDPMIHNGTNSQTLYTFDRSVNLTKGNLYHIKFINIDPNSIANYISVNELYVEPSLGTSARMPTVNIIDMAQMQQEGNDSWIVSTTHTPIFTLYYSDGHTFGQSYMYVPSENPRIINNAFHKVRSSFIISEANKMVNKVWVRIKKVSGTGDLTIRLEDSYGTLIEKGTVSADSIRINMTWVSLTFKTPHLLLLNSNYHLELSTSAETIYQTFALEDGNLNYGYGAMFPDGYFEYTNNGIDWFYSNDASYKAQVYFHQIIPITDIAVSAENGSNSITTDRGKLQLISSILPSEATNKKTVWSIANETGMASISSSGLVTAIANGTVKVNCKSSDGSEVFGTLLLTISNQISSVKFYPNPAYELINIRIDKTSMKPDFMRIINLSGKIVSQVEVDSFVEDFQIPTNLVQGVYIIQLISGNMPLFSQKLIIAK